MDKQRLTMIAILACGAAMVVAWSGGAVVAQSGQGQAATPAARIATVDVLALAERMMNAQELAGPREELDGRFRPQLEAIEEDVQRIDARLTQLQNTPNDPQVRTLLTQRQTRAEEYQNLIQSHQVQREQLIADQVEAIYARVRAAAERVAGARAYTHVITSRSIGQPMNALTAADALQDMLARPVLVAPEGDDLTAQVAAELGVQMAEQPAAAPPLPDPAPGAQPQR
jgi:Skp family chaperone for outer membrane proteins